MRNAHPRHTMHTMQHLQWRKSVPEVCHVRAKMSKLGDASNPLERRGGATHDMRKDSFMKWHPTGGGGKHEAYLSRPFG
jgi:hypothetical protein